MEALTSLSSKELHPLQVHSRSFNVSSLLIIPQTLQVFDDGAKRPICSMFLPCHSALYFNISTNIDQLTSVIACAKLWFLSIPLIFKSSSAIVSIWLSLINFAEVLCKKSLRLFTTFSCSKARRCLVRLPLFFEYFRCTYFNLLCALRKFFGFSILSPLEVIKKSLIPKSIPIVVSSLIGAFLGISVFVSTNIDTKYFPVGVLLIVALLIVPLISRWITTFIPFFLNLGIIKREFSVSKITFCGIEKDCLPRCLDLNFGKPAPLKKRLKAISIFWIDCCKDWLLTSFNHSHSFFKLGSCLIKSKALKLTLAPKYAVVFVSSAKLYANLLLPMCLAINSFWELVGDRRNLYDLNILQIYKKILEKKTIMSKTLITFVKCKLENECRLHPIHAKAMNRFYALFYKIIDDFEIKSYEDAISCEKLWDIDNGRCLCRKCHKKTDSWGSNQYKKKI